MGQRSPRETFLAVVHAFIAKPKWSQVSLAEEVKISVPALRKHLLELQLNKWPLTTTPGNPSPMWEVPKNWYPGALIFKQDEVADLVRLVARAPRSAVRARLLRTMQERMSAKEPTPPVDPDVVHTPAMTAEEERVLAMAEDSATRKTALHMRYFTASRGDEGWRHVSVHHVEAGPPARVIATCHRSGDLKWFRVNNVGTARLDAQEPYRPTTPAALKKFAAESLGGFHEGGAPVKCMFYVRRPESLWASRNLLPGMECETFRDEIRVSIETAAVIVVARFVVGLGDAATCDTPELAAAVAQLAKGALASAATPREKG
jgi:predicted DNA-binding transcriptional regulator YafY